MTDFTSLIAGLDLEDQTTVNAGAGEKLDPVPPGPKRARLVAYFELGDHLVPDQFQNPEKNKTRRRAVLGFEIFGKDVPRNGDHARVLWHWTALGHSAKSKFPKTAAKINYDGNTPHVAQATAITKPFLINVGLQEKGDKKFNTIETDGIVDVTPPVAYQPDEDGEMQAMPIKVPEAQAPVGLLLWDQVTPAMVESLKEYKFMIKHIQKAVSYRGSKVEALIEAAGIAALADDNAPEEAPAAADAPAKPAVKSVLDEFDD